MSDGLTILGSTGTIGVNTLDVVARNPERYRVVALTANTDHEKLAAQCRQWRPPFAVMADSQAAVVLGEALAGPCPDTRVLAGVEGLEEVASHPDTSVVMAAIVGAAGLLPTLAAARAGKRVLLANKESLVMAGRLFMEAVRSADAVLLPIDSEHNAIFQCLPCNERGRVDPHRGGVRRIILTASGGPFRTLGPDELEEVSPKQACAHPNWVMGRKISVDSATMMNKGLEVIEASWLFDTPPERIQVVVHPQSVIHSMVEYVDGSVLAELGRPDMRTPIAHALAWPERFESGVAGLDLVAAGRLDFEAPDLERFPCLRLAFEVAAGGGAASAVLNAANEVAVDAFLGGRLRFPDIPAVVENVLGHGVSKEPGTLEAVLEVDAEARRLAVEEVARRARAAA